MDVLLVAISLQVLAGTAAFIFSKWPRVASTLGAGGAVAGCLVGLAPTLRVLLGAPEFLRFAWDASHGGFYVEVDALNAFFLLPVLGLSALAPVYGGDYLLAYRHEKSLGSPWFFFNVFVAGMMMVVVARTAFLFLVAWEVMSLATCCLVERMQYTGRSFAVMIAEHLLPRFLQLHTARQAPRGLFPCKSDFGCDSPDPVSEKVYEPFFRSWFSRLHILQQGRFACTWSTSCSWSYWPWPGCL
jgi:hydrogenase-4 component B